MLSKCFVMWKCIRLCPVNFTLRAVVTTENLCGGGGGGLELALAENDGFLKCPT